MMFIVVGLAIIASTITAIFTASKMKTSSNGSSRSKSPRQPVLSSSSVCAPKSQVDFTQLLRDLRLSKITDDGMSKSSICICILLIFAQTELVVAGRGKAVDFTPMLDRETLTKYRGGIEEYSAVERLPFTKEKIGSSNCDDTGCMVDLVMDFDLRLKPKFTKAFVIDNGEAYKDTEVIVSVPQCLTTITYEYVYTDSAMMSLSHTNDGGCKGPSGFDEFKSPDGYSASSTLGCANPENLAFVQSEGGTGAGAAECEGTSGGIICQRRVIDPDFKKGMMVYTPDLVSARLNCKVCISTGVGETCAQLEGVENDNVVLDLGGGISLEMDSLPVASPLLTDPVGLYVEVMSDKSYNFTSYHNVKSFPPLGSPASSGLGMSQRVGLPIDGNTCPTEVLFGQPPGWAPSWNFAPSDSELCQASRSVREEGMNCEMVETDHPNNCTGLPNGGLCVIMAPTGKVIVFCEKGELHYDSSRLQSGKKFGVSGAKMHADGKFRIKSGGGLVRDCGLLRDYTHKPDCRNSSRVIHEDGELGEEIVVEDFEGGGSDHSFKVKVVASGLGSALLIHLITTRGQGIKSRVRDSNLKRFTKVGNTYVLVQNSTRTPCLLIAAVIILCVAVVAIIGFLVYAYFSQDGVCCTTDSFVIDTDRMEHVKNNLVPLESRYGLYHPIVKNPTQLSSEFAGKMSQMEITYDGLNSASASMRLRAVGFHIDFNDNKGVLNQLTIPKCKVVLGASGSVLTIGAVYDGLSRNYQITSDTITMFANSVPLTQGAQEIEVAFTGIMSEATKVSIRMDDFGKEAVCESPEYVDGNPDGDGGGTDSGSENPFYGVSWKDFVFGDTWLAVFTVASWVIGAIAGLFVLAVAVRVSYKFIYWVFVYMCCRSMDTADAWAIPFGVYSVVGKSRPAFRGHKIDLTRSNGTVFCRLDVPIPPGYPEAYYNNMDPKEEDSSAFCHKFYAGTWIEGTAGAVTGISVYQGGLWTDEMVDGCIPEIAFHSRICTDPSLSYDDPYLVVQGFANVGGIEVQCGLQSPLVPHVTVTRVTERRVGVDRVTEVHVEYQLVERATVIDAVLDHLDSGTLSVLATNIVDKTPQCYDCPGCLVNVEKQIGVVLLHETSTSVRHTRGLALTNGHLLHDSGEIRKFRMGGPILLKCQSAGVTATTPTMESEIEVFCSNRVMRGFVSMPELEFHSLNIGAVRGLSTWVNTGERTRNMAHLSHQTDLDLYMRPEFEVEGFPVIVGGQVTCAIGECLLTTGDWDSYQVLKTGDVLSKYISSKSFKVWYQNKEHSFTMKTEDACACVDFKTCLSCLREYDKWVWALVVCIPGTLIGIAILVTIVSRLGRRLVAKVGSAGKKGVISAGTKAKDRIGFAVSGAWSRRSKKE